MLSSYYPKNDHYEMQHTRVSKEPDNLTGGQKIHVSMIFLHSIFHGATAVIQNILCYKKHKDIARCSLLSEPNKTRRV